MVKEKKQVWLPILFALVMIMGMIIGYNLKKHTSTNSFFNNATSSPIQEVLSLVRNKYVDPVKMDSIAEITINDLLAHLDPHSLYIPPINVADVNEEMMGNFQGVGIEFQIFNDTVFVVNVIPEGPSAKAGILKGDKLITVNDSIKIAGVKITSDKIRKYFRGKAESKVTVSLLRDNILKKITITRGVIPVSTIDAAYIIEPKTGYIKINKFGDKTYEEFMTHLEKLQKQGLANLIVDLRGNSGGLMNEAVDIADEFLSDNKIVVYTEGNKSPKNDYKTKRDGLFEQGNLFILVDETSASASEVLTGALQDWDRATIIGKRTFGKGLVQQQFPLSNGAALRLTIARYFTPLGRNIQKPYNHKSVQEYRRDALNGEEIIDTLDTDTTHQKHIYKTPKGKIVYGGGGILPDILINDDSVSFSSLVFKLYQTNILNNAAIQIYLNNKTALSKYTSANQYYQDFKLNNNDWILIENLANKKSISLNNIKSSERLQILADVQKLVARFLFGENAYYEVANKTDKMVLKCLEILNNKP